MKKLNRKVERRKVNFAQRIVSEVWQEQPNQANPYIAETCACYGYDLLELMQKRTYPDVLFLLFKGELPNREQSELLEKLLIGFINPGPRHPATRAAMTAGVGRTDPAHILPIALNVLSGERLGVTEVSSAMQFLRDHSARPPAALLTEQLKQKECPNEDWSPLPGFGRRFGSRDLLPNQLAKILIKSAASGPSLCWGDQLTAELEPYGAGWLATGVVAATLNDLGFDPRTGSTLFQIISAPGMLAHGLELSRRSLTAMPFPADENYIIETGQNDE